jgi:hypothetical protein
MWKKAYHTIRVSDTRGIFPYCEECAQTRTLQEKLDAAKALSIEWAKLGSPESLQFWDNVASIIREES